MPIYRNDDMVTVGASYLVYLASFPLTPCPVFLISSRKHWDDILKYAAVVNDVKEEVITAVTL